PEVGRRHRESRCGPRPDPTTLGTARRRSNRLSAETGFPADETHLCIAVITCDEPPGEATELQTRGLHRGAEWRRQYRPASLRVGSPAGVARRPQPPRDCQTCE